MLRKATLLTLFASLFFAIYPAQAQNNTAFEAGEIHTWFFDALTIGRGYTVSAPDEMFHVGVLPDVLKGETSVTIKVFDHAKSETRQTYMINAAAETVQRINLDWPLPENKVIISPVYEFDIKGAADLYNPEMPLWLRIHFQAEMNDNKAVYYFDKGRQEWVLIPTEMNVHDKSLRAAIHLTYAPMAILADAVPSEGVASWYKYHGCNCAASRDYPHGTLLTVRDTDSGKSVIVEVNDYGPEAWTGRIIDLDLVAFEAISNRRKGLTQVTVTPYLPTPEEVEKGLPSLFDDQL